jgi:urease accessory protein
VSPALDVVFAEVGGRTRMTRRRHRWPLLVGRVFPDPVDPRVGSVTIQNAAGTLIPGDAVRQRIEVVDGGSAVLRGQGATTVSGVPGGAAAAEEAELRVAAGCRLVLAPAPRILTPHARHRQHTRLWVQPGGAATVTDAMVLHPDLAPGTFGGWESSVEIFGPAGELLVWDSQASSTLPRVRRVAGAFATVYLVGADPDPALMHALEGRRPGAGDCGAYLAAGELPNGAGWVVRVAASDGRELRDALAALALPAAITATVPG